MKTRTGFVSNSSSTSFTCDVCGETQSGMDLSRSEAGMQECINGHVFCDTHEISAKASPDQMRQVLIAAREKYRNATWKKPGEVDAEIAEINAFAPDVLEEEFREFCNDAGCFPDCCPICQFQAVDDIDVVRFTLLRFGYSDRKTLAKAWKEEFKTYDALQEYLKLGKTS